MAIERRSDWLTVVDAATAGTQRRVVIEGCLELDLAEGCRGLPVNRPRQVLRPAGDANLRRSIKSGRGTQPHDAAATGPRHGANAGIDGGDGDESAP